MSTLISPEPVQAAPRPPLTYASADRLFWRQEWARHWPVWLNGLALWFWLFLVPGQTTEESQVLRWSILWTGALALVLAGDDVRRGVDPLVRGLALAPRRRWQMRTTAVLAGSMLFYLAGCLATAEALAHHLWSFVASGDFIGAPDSAPSLFVPWQGLAVVALVAVLCCLAAANFHGIILGLAYAGAVWLASYGFAGMAPLALHGLPGVISPSLEWDTLHSRAFTLGIACGILALVGWLIGSRHAARRSAILTSGRPASLFLISLGVIGALTFAQLTLWTLAYRDFPAKASNSTILMVGTDPHDHSTLATGWVWLALAEIALIAAWWWSHYRSHRSAGGRSTASAASRWFPWLAGSLVLFHLIVQPGSAFFRQTPGLAYPWPPPLTNLTVSSSQTWEEAYHRPTYTTVPTHYDVFLWAFYPGHKSEPIAVRSGLLAMPMDREKATELTLVFPENMLWGQSQEFQVKLFRAAQQPPPRTGVDAEPGVLPSELRLQLMSRALGAGPWIPLKNHHIPGHFTARHFMPVNLEIASAGPQTAHVGWSILFLPQRPDQPATTRPWSEIVSPPNGFRLLKAPPTFNPGLLGLGEALNQFQIPLSLLIPPIVLLGGILLCSVRFGGLALVALASSLLLVYIWADARRIEKELMISGDLSRPEYQRDLARAKASVSFFHKLDLRTTP